MATALAVDLEGEVVVRQHVTSGRSDGGPVWGVDTVAVLKMFGSDDADTRLMWWDVHEADGYDGEPLVDFKIRDRWPDTGGLTGIDYTLIVNDARLWTFERVVPREHDGHQMRLHVLARDGSEVLGENGQLLRWRARPDSLSVTPDGGVWYVADVPGEAPEERPGLRAIRRGPDGAVQAISPLLVDYDAVEFDEVQGSLVRATWGEVTADGAYVMHYVAVSPDRLAWMSYFRRIERDGTLSWAVRTRHDVVASRGSYLADLAMDEHQGGVVAVIGQYDDRNDMRLWRVTADGELVWSRDGRRVYTELREAEDEGAVIDVEVASDGEATFVTRVIERDHGVGGATTEGYIQRFTARGEPSWEPDGPGVPIDGVAPIQLAPDNRQGVWAISLTALQHYDARGHPLFYMMEERCEDGGLARSRTFEARP